MKSYKKLALILAIIAVVLLVVGIYALSSPVFYGSSYYHASFYEGEDFNGTMTFYDDNTMVIRNTNFDDEYKSYYYYKDGYIFFTLATTEAEYEEEIAAINEDFEGAVNALFYASKINAFRLCSEGPDGFVSVYFCQIAIMMAVVLSVMELALIGVILVTLSRGKRETARNK